MTTAFGMEATWRLKQFSVRRVMVTGLAAWLVIGSASHVMALTPQEIDARDAARRAAMARARGEVERAQAMLQAATERVRATWDAKPQGQSAKQAVEDARKDFESAKAKVIDRLKEQPEYAQAEQADREAQADLHREAVRTRATQPATTQPAGAAAPAPNLPAPSLAQVEAATDKLKSRSKLQDLEEAAIAKDPAASKAEAKLNEAQQAAKQWQLQYEAALQNDPDYKSALNQLATARANAQAAAAGNY